MSSRSRNLFFTLAAAAVLAAGMTTGCGGDGGGDEVDAAPTDLTLSKVQDQSIDEDGTTGSLSFTVSASGATLTAESSNKTLVPDANIELGGSGTSRTVTVRPAMDQTGTTTIKITGRVGSRTGTTSFNLTVKAVNDAPTISDITDKTTEEGTALPAIPFTVGDAETMPGSLTVTATSGNTGLVPASGVVLGGTGASRTLTITPAASGTGTAIITVKVSDGMLDATDTFTVTVTRSNSVNDPPVNKVPGAQSKPENTTLVFSSANGNEISVSDPDAGNAAIKVTLAVSGGIGSLTLTGTTGLTFQAGDGTGDTTMTFTGTVAAINTALNGLKLAPPADFSGTGSLTITTNDQGNTGSGGAQQDVDTVQVDFQSINDPPTITEIADKSIAEDSTTGSLGFIINDPDNAVATLTVTRDSSNTDVIPLAGVVLGGTGGNRTVTVTPAKDAVGSSIITLTVSDGKLSTSMMFTVAVTGVEDNPTIENVANQSMNAGQSKVVEFTIGDAETKATDLVVTFSQTGSPTLGITLGGAGATRAVTLMAPENMNGTVTVTLTVKDAAERTATDMFTVTVNNINDPPVITAPTTTQLLHSDGGGAGTGTLSFTDDNPITVADPDIGTSNLSLRLEATHGTTITGDLPGGVTRTAGADDSADQTLSGPIDKINEVLDGLLFTSAPGFGAGNATLKVSANDGGASGTGGAQDAEPKTITIKVNTKPTITEITDKSINEDGNTGNIAFTINDFDQGTANLTVTATSSNHTLVPEDDAHLLLGGSAGARTVKVTPVHDGSGTATITITVTDSDGGERSEAFLLTVDPVNDAPVLDFPETASTTEDVELAFSGTVSVDDVDDDILDSVTLEATNGTITLATIVGLDFATGTGSDDAVVTFSGSLEDINAALDGATFLPEGDFNGDAAVQITISDGALQDTGTVNIDVVASNDAPVITSADGLATLVSNTERSIKLSVSDVDVSGSQKVEVTFIVGNGATLTIPTRTGLTFSGGSTGTGGETMVKFQGTLADVNASLSGTGVKVTPTAAFNGDVTVTGTVSDLGNTGPDGVRVTTASWVTTYANANTAPTITKLADHTIVEDLAGGYTAPFTVGDGQTGAGNLTVTATATPNGGDPVVVTLTVGGSGTMRTVTAVPNANDHGKTTISVKVSDGALTSMESFVLTVTAVNDPPVIEPETITVAAMNEDGTVDVSFIATDADGTTPTMAISSDNTTLLPNSSFTMLSTTHVRIKPVADLSGSATVTLTASDGTAVDTRTFNVTVRAVNDPPVLGGAYPTLTVSDKEVGDGTFQVTIDADGGTVTLKTIADLTFVDGDDDGTTPDGDGNQDAHMIFRGSKAAVNAALNGVIDSVENGTITITLSDLGVSPPTDVDPEGLDILCVEHGTGVCP